MLKRLLTIAFLLASLVALQAQAANMYKYQDNEGKRFVGSVVPAEFVKNGYEVLDARGRVIEVVPRALTKAEIEALKESEQEEQLAEKEQARQEEEDKLLLRLYRSPEEVVRRRDSTVNELEDQLSVLRSQLADAESDVESIQQIITNNEEAGRTVPANQLARLESATSERDRLKRQIARIEAEKAETIEMAERNIERLKVLLNL